MLRACVYVWVCVCACRWIYLAAAWFLFGSKRKAQEASTERILLAPQGMLHLEGGWPKDIDPTDADQKMRFCKNKLRGEDYIFGICRATEVANRCVQENNAVNIYEDYFSGTYSDLSSEPPSAKTLTVFR